MMQQYYNTAKFNKNCLNDKIKGKDMHCSIKWASYYFDVWISCFFCLFFFYTETPSYYFIILRRIILFNKLLPLWRNTLCIHKYAYKHAYRHTSYRASAPLSKTGFQCLHCKVDCISNHKNHSFSVCSYAGLLLSALHYIP